jgi:hypothetical protein
MAAFLQPMPGVEVNVLESLRDGRFVFPVDLCRLQSLPFGA